MFVSLATPFEMMQSDALATKQYGIPEELLMENAGREAFSVLQRTYGSLKNNIAFVFAGAGNNGGDGVVLSRYLKEAGVYVLVILEKPVEEFTKTAHWHYSIAKRYGVNFCSVDEFYAEFAYSVTPNIIVDALLGIGFKGELSSSIMERIRYINSFINKAYIFSLDIPSGLHPFTGKVSPIAVHASATATFHTPKISLYMPSAKEYTGTIHVCTIGLPENIQKHKYQLLFNAPAKPVVQQNIHKHSAGRVLVIGGSEEYIGAPIFCAKSAYAMGAGSVSIATLQTVAPRIRSIAYESIVHSLPFIKWNAMTFIDLQPMLSQYDAVIVGPGMGSSAGVKDFVFAMLQYKKRPPMIFDADAVRTIALLDTTLASHLQTTDILTPHIGELSQMLFTSSENIKNNKLDIADICKMQSEAVVLMKDAGSIVVQKNEAITISPFITPNLAVAGSGDVLCGIIAGELLKKKSPFIATCSAVYYHAMVGEYLQNAFPFRGNTPNDIIQAIPTVLKNIYCS